MSVTFVCFQVPEAAWAKLNALLVPELNLPGVSFTDYSRDLPLDAVSIFVLEAVIRRASAFARSATHKYPDTHTHTNGYTDHSTRVSSYRQHVHGCRWRQVTVLENVLDPSHLPFTHHLTISNRAAAGPLHLRVVLNNEGDHAAAAAAAATTGAAAAAAPGGITASGFAAVRWRPSKDPEPGLAASPAAGSSGVTFTAPHLVVSATQRPGSFADYNVVRGNTRNLEKLRVTHCSCGTIKPSLYVVSPSVLVASLSSQAEVYSAAFRGAAVGVLFLLHAAAYQVYAVPSSPGQCRLFVRVVFETAAMPPPAGVAMAAAFQWLPRW